MTPGEKALIMAAVHEYAGVGDDWRYNDSAARAKLLEAIDAYAVNDKTRRETLLKKAAVLDQIGDWVTEIKQGPYLFTEAEELIDAVAHVIQDVATTPRTS